MSAVDIEYQIAHNCKILTNILGNSAFLVPMKTYSPVLSSRALIFRGTKRVILRISSNALSEADD